MLCYGGPLIAMTEISKPPKALCVQRPEQTRSELHVPPRLLEDSMVLRIMFGVTCRYLVPC